MVEDRKEEESAFKVVDRRRFTEDGEERPSLLSQEESRAFRDVPKEEAKPSSKNARPPITFSLFVQSLAHQAMMGLGIMPWPDSGLVRKELELAKETIDILRILQDKSKNNLTKDEQNVLDTLLYQLQVAYVEIAKQPPEKNTPIIK